MAFCGKVLRRCLQAHKQRVCGVAHSKVTNIALMHFLSTALLFLLHRPIPERSQDTDSLQTIPESKHKVCKGIRVEPVNASTAPPTLSVRTMFIQTHRDAQILYSTPATPMDFPQCQTCLHKLCGL